MREKVKSSLPLIFAGLKAQKEKRELEGVKLPLPKTLVRVETWPVKQKDGSIRRYVQIAEKRTLPNGERVKTEKLKGKRGGRLWRLQIGYLDENGNLIKLDKRKG